ncbi:MAG: tRNA (guanosine(46)-N7)-methyltransferase TrmB [Pseudomonadota bacterium]
MRLRAVFATQPNVMKKKTCETNPYVEMMYTTFKDWSFDENANENRGLWRKEVFRSTPDRPLDLEIGTGNGTHFAQLAEANPDRLFIGLELKYKTLVQSIRRALRAGCTNSRMARYRAEGLNELFENGEINDVYIHFPDPWPKKRHNKNRLINNTFLDALHGVMKPGSFVEFKTDDLDYFEWAVRFFNESAFTISFYSEDLHNSFRQDKNFVTHFESLFLKKKQPIFYCRLLRS